jgi:hypothetical protein
VNLSGAIAVALQHWMMFFALVLGSGLTGTPSFGHVSGGKEKKGHSDEKSSLNYWNESSSSFAVRVSCSFHPQTSMYHVNWPLSPFTRFLGSSRALPVIAVNNRRDGGAEWRLA